MRFRLHALPLLFPSLLLALPAQAALQMKPGLWETRFKTQAGSPGANAAMDMLRQHMANMTPEQRKQMEAAIARHGGGMSMPDLEADGSVVAKICVTKEMIAKSQLPTQPNQAGCSFKNSPLAGNVLTVTFSCTNPPTKGETRVVMQSDSAYTATMTSTSTFQGHTENIKAQGTGKWLSADCGSVKPPASAAQ